VIAHLSIGVKDLVAARRFYDAALAPLGYRCLYPRADHAGYGAQAAYFWLNEVARPVPPDPESGLHICFDAPSRAAVDAFHAASLAAGATDNGKPGVRPQYRQPYYAAFVIDPDGYRIEAYCGKE
jgi:catechol 2,3-dioxygenase-like lactoylglutathione lyase family enzyme